jgi:Flp pilus assembly protein TadG
MLVMPLLFTLVFGMLALAIMFYSAFAAEAAVAQGARRAGITGSAAAGRTEAARIMSVIGPSAAVSWNVSINAAPGCERAVLARLDSGASVRVPLVELFFRLRAGSQARRWQFWAGPPADGCE